MGDDQPGSPPEEPKKAKPRKDFKSMRGAQFLRLLQRKPLQYRVVDKHGSSHHDLRSENGYPEVKFSFHDNQEIPPGLVQSYLTKQVGLSDEDARSIL